MVYYNILTLVKMQYLTNLQSHTLEWSLAALFWAYFAYTNSAKVSANKWIGFVLFVNIITIAACYHSPIDAIVVSSLIHILAHPQINKAQQFLLTLILILVQPVYSTVLVLRKIILITKQSPNKYLLWIQVLFWLVISLFSLFTINYSFYFPTEFDTNSGVTWLLYSHQFQNYLLLYQVIFTLSPYIIIIPLAAISLPYFSKLTIIYFICIFTHPHPSLICVWGLYCLQSLVYGEIMSKANQRQKLIWKILTLMMIVITIPTYIFYERLLWVWQNTHMISVGYILVQILLFWGTHSVYLSELLIILDEPEQEDNRRLIHKLIGYFKTRIQSM